MEDQKKNDNVKEVETGISSPAEEREGDQS